MTVARYKGRKEIGKVETLANTGLNGNDHESIKATWFQ